jgi:hypothetical protein
MFYQVFPPEAEFRFQVSAKPLAAEAARLIGKETRKKRMSNVKFRVPKECILSIFKKTEGTETTLRYSTRLSSSQAAALWLATDCLTPETRNLKPDSVAAASLHWGAGGLMK